ncbi:metal-dependent hydrolase [Metabacillus hrfriensis]|uniref:Metal-dependent hydrolase n=1 Tax=Metabacillus hrfriensis TaxID=3048891 RepID=A0ACD4RFI9_9BACI|nr:metal-dependent hydrolase [Metabacillus sp. CT-WN-B3]WHZ59093.1 metal-dependent hydrolase [Metabacillus sp. CT-WN-B3]
MRYDTHIITSVTAGAGISLILSVPFTFGYVTGIIIGSILPDIDEPNSYISRRSFSIYKVINSKYGHQGITHSLFIWLIFSIFSLSIFHNFFGLGLSLGYLFHILGDLFSVSGVPLLMPFGAKKIQLPKYLTYKTSSDSETSIFFFSFIILVTILAIVVDSQFVTSLHSFKTELIKLTSRFS